MFFIFVSAHQRTARMSWVVAALILALLALFGQQSHADAAVALSAAELPDPLDFTPDIKEQVRILREIGAASGNEGHAANIEKVARKFAMLVYRRLGRDPNQTSRLDAARAADDLMLIRADVVNAIQAMYVCTKREKHHAGLDKITDRTMRDTLTYVRAVRTTLKRGNVYEGGRGFPAAWSDAYDPAYDMIL
jgi:hypothetical protein